MEAFHWYKTTLEFLKGNKVLLLLVTTALASGTAGYTLPSLIKAKPVQVTVTAPNDELRKEIKRLKDEIRKLKRWHQ